MTRATQQIKLWLYVDPRAAVRARGRFAGETALELTDDFLASLTPEELDLLAHYVGLTPPPRHFCAPDDDRCCGVTLGEATLEAVADALEAVLEEVPAVLADGDEELQEEFNETWRTAERLLAEPQLMVSPSSPDNLFTPVQLSAEAGSCYDFAHGVYKMACDRVRHAETVRLRRLRAHRAKRRWVREQEDECGGEYRRLAADGLAALGCFAVAFKAAFEPTRAPEGARS